MIKVPPRGVAAAASFALSNNVCMQQVQQCVTLAQHPAACWVVHSASTAAAAPAEQTPITVLVAAGIGVAGQALGAYLLSTEMIGASWRGVAGIITQARISNLTFNVANDGSTVELAKQEVHGQLTCMHMRFIWS
jgi:hypothetical protein